MTCPKAQLITMKKTGCQKINPTKKKTTDPVGMLVFNRESVRESLKRARFQHTVPVRLP